MEYPEFTDFIAYLHLKNLASATVEKYQQVLKRLLDYIDLGPSPPSQITTAQLRDYVASLHERELALKTIRNYVVVTKRFFGFLLAEGYIKQDPSRRLPTPKVGKRLPRALTVPQAQALFAAMTDETLAGHRDQVFFKLVYACGLRVGEAVQVRVADINWEEGWLRVIGKGNEERRTWQKADGRWRMGTISYKPSAISQFGPCEPGHDGDLFSARRYDDQRDRFEHPDGPR